MNAHALEVLEFHRVLERVATRASSEQGRERIRRLRPSGDRAFLLEEFERVRETVVLQTERPAWAPPAEAQDGGSRPGPRRAPLPGCAPPLRPTPGRIPPRRARGVSPPGRPGPASPHRRGSRGGDRADRSEGRSRPGLGEPRAPADPGSTAGHPEPHRPGAGGIPVESAGPDSRIGRLCDPPGRTVCHPGSPRGAERGGRHRPRRVRQRSHPLRRAPAGRGAHEHGEGAGERRVPGDPADPPLLLGADPA